jgi:tRNA pseudouridine65 synthase
MADETLAGQDALRVLFADEYFVVVDKPAGLLVHRSAVDRSERRALLPQVRAFVGARVHAVHRLDKGTSGAVVFARSAGAAAALSQLFREDRVDKRYLAIVRGWAPDEVVVDHALADVADPRAGVAASEPRTAVTLVRALAQAEWAHAVGRYATARYSLVECRPRSGRRHQIRRHLKHIRHPVIGDANYGDLRHNRFFREELGIGRLLLANVEIGFVHPFTGDAVRVLAPLDAAFRRALDQPEWGGAGGQSR